MTVSQKGATWRKVLSPGLCLLGAAGVLAGMLTGGHALFLGGLLAGVSGYLGIRRALKRRLEQEERGQGEEESG